jgi:uncharacterized protein YjlB
MLTCNTDARAQSVKAVDYAIVPNGTRHGQNHNPFLFRAVVLFVKGADYDLEIVLDEWTVCADIKCK